MLSMDDIDVAWPKRWRNNLDFYGSCLLQLLLLNLTCLHVLSSFRGSYFWSWHRKWNKKSKRFWNVGMTKIDHNCTKPFKHTTTWFQHCTNSEVRPSNLRPVKQTGSRILFSPVQFYLYSVFYNKNCLYQRYLWGSFPSFWINENRRKLFPQILFAQIQKKKIKITGSTSVINKP